MGRNGWLIKDMILLLLYILQVNWYSNFLRLFWKLSKWMIWRKYITLVIILYGYYCVHIKCELMQYNSAFHIKILWISLLPLTEHMYQCNYGLQIFAKRGSNIYLIFTYCENSKQIWILIPLWYCTSTWSVPLDWGSFEEISIFFGLSFKSITGGGIGDI